MGLIDFSLDEHVAVMTWNSDDNRFNPDFLNALLETLDRIETDTAATALVVTSSHEKIFSNGIDLEWLAPAIQSGDTHAAKGFFYLLNKVFKRLVTYPMVTIAAMNGHAFAGGAIISCCFDFRFMRSGRGFFCLPEVDLHIPFLPGMNALLRNAISGPMLREMQLTGVRLTAEQCEAAGIIRQALPPEKLLGTTVAFAKTVDKQRATLAELKARLYHQIVEAIDVADVPYIESGRFYIG